MSKSRSSRTHRQAPMRNGSYWDRSRRPLQILAFLLPLIVAYELALTFLLQSSEAVRTVLAHVYLLRFFDAFNIAPEAALHMGGIAIIVVMLVWHVLNRDPCRLDYPGVGIMAIESVVLTVPLIVVGQVIRKAASPAIVFFAQDATADWQHMDLLSQLAISMGAGLYEELVFRMLLIAVLHTLLVDVGKASHGVGASIAVVISAAAFTAYHPLRSNADLVFYFLAGLYFGIIYVMRGFGIVVGVHAAYDVITFLVLNPISNR